MVCIVDLGFSASYIVPTCEGQVLTEAVKRLNVGGKLLTNYLKEVVSYRQYNMMDEFRLLNTVKESLCYVAPHMPSEVKEACGPSIPAEKSAYVEWILPDYRDTMEGRKRDLEVVNRGGRNIFKRTRQDDPNEEQALRMELERFSVPELLFTPPDVGLRQAGLAESIAEAVSLCAPELQGLLFSNIVLTGGGCQFPGLVDRLHQDLRPLVPDHMDLAITVADEPLTQAWQGAADWSRSDAFGAVSRRDYEEGGADYCQERLGNNWPGMAQARRHR